MRHADVALVNISRQEWRALEGAVPVGGPGEVEAIVARAGRLFGDDAYGARSPCDGVVLGGESGEDSPELAALSPGEVARLDWLILLAGREAVKRSR